MFARFQEYHRYREKNKSLFGGRCHKIAFVWIFNNVSRVTTWSLFNLRAPPRSSTWIVLNCILFVIVLDSRCWWLDKGLSRVLKERQSFWCFGASFSIFGCSVFEIWVLRFRVLGVSCFGLRFRVLRFRHYHRPDHRAIACSKTLQIVWKYFEIQVFFNTLWNQNNYL